MIKGLLHNYMKSYLSSCSFFVFFVFNFECCVMLCLHSTAAWSDCVKCSYLIPNLIGLPPFPKLCSHPSCMFCSSVCESSFKTKECVGMGVFLQVEDCI